MLESWQDVVVTVAAAAAAITVVWRTLGTFGDARPGRGAPGCDHCVLQDVVQSARSPVYL
jgi:hypothetical protein